MEAILRRAEQRAHDSDEEKILIQQAQGGDRMAFEELIRRHDREILRLAFHMLGNREEAREVFQETFLKAYRSLNRFRFESSFYTWIYRIATNVGLDHLRKRQTLKKRCPTNPTRNPIRTAGAQGHTGRHHVLQQPGTPSLWPGGWGQNSGSIKNPFRKRATCI
jgi:DNA-directed RNA polymerase specialized sigma24 family protein